jgi:hypothetical protein
MARTSRKGVYVLAMESKRSRRIRRRQGHSPCPHCDQPDTSLLRLVLIGEILRADETLLVLLADVLQASGLLYLSEEPTARPVRRQQGTVHPFRQSDADRQ